MKRILVMIMIISTFLVFPEDISAEETELTPSQARWSLVEKGLELTTGLLAGFIGHESGHQVVAWLENVDMTWYYDNDKVGIPLWWWAHTGNNKTKLRNIALGGFASEILSTELILSYDKIPKDNAFVLGYLAWNTFNPIYYSLMNETRKRGHGDLKTLDECGVKSEYVEIVIISHALLSAYRLYKKPEFLPYMRATKQELIIGLSWRW